MVWAIGLIPTNNSSFLLLKARLLLSYLGVMTSILGAFSLTVYHLVSYNFYKQLDLHLLTLAQTGAASLQLVKHEVEEAEEDSASHASIQSLKASILPHLEASNLGQNTSHKLTQLRTLSDLIEKEDSPLGSNYLYAQPDQSHFQSLEWFDASRKLLIREGNLQDYEALPETIPQSGLVTQNQEIRHYILPVYREVNSQKVLEGYIRASESTELIDSELKRLQLSLSMGGIVALGLTAIGGLWLTRRAVKPMEKSFAQLQQFTADASHELRSPLTAIKTTLSLFQNHPERIQPQDLPKIGTLVTATEQMTDLVNDLLLLSKMDGLAFSGSSRFRTVSLEEILEDLVDEVVDIAHQKQIYLEVKLLPHCYIKAYPDPLKRLFNNLLRNALKYTPMGGKVQLSMAKVAQFVVVTCQDTGIGIAPEDIPHIFDRFWQADKARSRSEGGFGLGLAIAQSIAHLHQGQITVTSKVGHGSCFQVRLPLTQ